MKWIGGTSGGAFTDVVAYDEGTGALEIEPGMPDGVVALGAQGRRILYVSPADTVAVRRLTMPTSPAALRTTETPFTSIRGRRPF